MKRFKVFTTIVMLFILSTTLLAGCSRETAKNTKATANNPGKDDYVVKLGYYNCDHMTGAVIAKDAGIFDELGLKVEVTGNGKVPQAMAAGQMDVGYIGVNGLFKAAVKGSPILIGADNHIGGSYYLVVANDIKDPKELIGKELGIGSKPETTSEAWIQFAEELGIPVEGSNYKGIDFSSDKDKYLALKTGKIKGYMCCDPWASMAEYEGTGKILAVNSKLKGEWGDCCVLSLNKTFIEEHPELVKKMVLAHTKALEYIYQHPLKSAKIFAKNYMVPEEVALLTIYKKTVAEGRTLSWEFRPDAVNNEIKFQSENKFFEGTTSFEQLAVTKFLEECGADDFNQFIKEKVDPIYPIGMSYEDWKKKINEQDK